MKSITPMPSMAAASTYSGAPKAEAMDSKKQKAWNQAVDFESVFINTMFSQMFSGIRDEGPLGGKHNEAWRGMLVEEYSKMVASQGGIGLAPHIYSELIGAQQAAAPRPVPAGSLPR